MRDNWDIFFMNIAREVATRATCNRKHVGAILTIDNSIVATGYNGSISKMGHCDDIGHLMHNGSCVRTIHAEVNAIANAVKRGVVLNNSTVYITCEPCWNCFKILIASGVCRIVYDEPYNTEEKFFKEKKNEVIKQLKIKYEKHSKNNLP